MSIGGVGGGRDDSPFRADELKGPSGAGKPFNLPSTDWKESVIGATDQLNPDNPGDIHEALRTLTQVVEDPATPQPVKNTVKLAADQVEQGYLVSKNPMELMEPYLALCNITQPLGPGLS